MSLPNIGTAAHISVVVRVGGGTAVAAARSEHRRRATQGRTLVLLATAATLAIYGFQAKLKIERNGWVPMIVTLAILGIALPVVWGRHKRKLRARVHAIAGVWSSRELVYLGPGEPEGLPGAIEFMAKHAPKAIVSTPPVTLVLVEDQLVIVPSAHDHRDTLTCGLNTITTIEINTGPWNRGGVSLLTRDARRATFTGKTDESLATALIALGATRYRGETEPDNGGRKEGPA